MIKATKIYKSIHLASEILETDLHRPTQLLMDDFLTQVNIAKGFMERHNYVKKSTYINKSIDILNDLLLSLELEKGREIAEVLDELYRYMLSELVKANMTNNPIILEKIKHMMQNIKDGWNATLQDIRNSYAKVNKQKKDTRITS